MDDLIEALKRSRLERSMAVTTSRLGIPMLFLQPSQIYEPAGFPQEIVWRIFQSLDMPSCKKARLICRQWGQVGAYFLSDRIYFAPRSDLLEAFRDITANPVIAGNIRELVYDARMFWQGMLEGAMYNPASISDQDMNSAGTSCRRYASLLQEQTSILAAKEDLEVLCRGLRSLPKLERVMILDSFKEPLFHHPFLQNGYDWYHRKSAAAFNGIVSPSRWTDAYDMARDLRLTKFPWNFEGIWNLLEALFLHGPRLEELHFGCDMSKLSFQIYGSPKVLDDVVALASRLTVFRFSCRAVRGHDTEGIMHTTQAICKQAERLEELYLNLETNVDVSQSIFKKMSFPRLKILYLAGGFMDLETFELLASNHGNTLRELAMRSVTLRARPWTYAVLRSIGDLKLGLISLALMREGRVHEVGKFYDMSEHRTLVTASMFMNSISRDDVINTYHGDAPTARCKMKHHNIRINLPNTVSSRLHFDHLLRAVLSVFTV